MFSRDRVRRIAFSTAENAPAWIVYRTRGISPSGGGSGRGAFTAQADRTSSMKKEMQCHPGDLEKYAVMRSTASRRIPSHLAARAGAGDKAKARPDMIRVFLCVFLGNTPFLTFSISIPDKERFCFIRPKLHPDLPAHQHIILPRKHLPSLSLPSIIH